jgi:8-oxo-dGTP diphosphatase
MASGYQHRTAADTLRLVPDSTRLSDLVTAAGAVVWHYPTDVASASSNDSEPNVVLVHRARHDDWSLPKGKVDAGEALPGTAVREVTEETGLEVRLGLPLSDVTYPLGTGQTKRVAYWTAEVTSGAVEAYAPNTEVDRVEWSPLSKALDRVSYDRDRIVLEEFSSQFMTDVASSRPMIVLRHAEAKPRTHWRGDDRRRTLTTAGQRQAEALVPMLAAWGVKRIASSDSARCVQTVQPYATRRGTEVTLHRRLTEEDADRDKVRSITRRLFASSRRAVLCTHRPVLPMVFDAIDVPDPHLEPGELLVVHRRDGEVIAIERHRG